MQQCLDVAQTGRGGVGAPRQCFSIPACSLTVVLKLLAHCSRRSVTSKRVNTRTSVIFVAVDFFVLFYVLCAAVHHLTGVFFCVFLSP